MKFANRFGLGIILSLFLVACSGVPSTPNQMRDKWSDICALSVVERFTVTYDNPEVVINQSTPNCFNAVSSGLTPNEEREDVAIATGMFKDVCRSNLTRKARIVLKGRTIGQYDRTCAR